MANYYALFYGELLDDFVNRARRFVTSTCALRVNRLIVARCN